MLLIEVLVHQAVFERLREVARFGGLIYYSEIAPIAGAHWRNLGLILGEICCSEVRQGRPMIGSVVVRKDSNIPGKGFFEGARRLGLFQGVTDEDRREFWTQELNRVYDYWSSH